MSFLSEGREKEKTQSDMFENVKFSDNITDMNKHIDFTSNDIAYDFKGLKKIKRDDSETNESYHYVEIKNVNGALGWLYGEADGFIFETNKYLVVVSKDKLQEFIKKNTIKTYVKNPDEALYCLYQRSGRKDVITLITTIDLMTIATEIKVKEKGIIEHTIGDSVISEKRLKQRMSRIQLK